MPKDKLLVELLEFPIFEFIVECIEEEVRKLRSEDVEDDNA